MLGRIGMVLKIIYIESRCMERQKRDSGDFEQELPAADTGNASNPTPHDDKMIPEECNQLLGKRAETYIRESANIEDLPDPQQELNADEVIDGQRSE